MLVTEVSIDMTIPSEKVEKRGNFAIILLGKFSPTSPHHLSQDKKLSHSAFGWCSLKKWCLLLWQPEWHEDKVKEIREAPEVTNPRTIFRFLLCEINTFLTVYLALLRVFYELEPKTSWWTQQSESSFFILFSKWEFNAKSTTFLSKQNGLMWRGFILQ